MLEVQSIRNSRDIVNAGLIKKGCSAEQLGSLDEIVTLDDERKKTQTESDKILFDYNTLSKDIGELFKSGKHAEANALKANVADLKEEIKEYDAKSKEIGEKLYNLLIQLPNIPHNSVPQGKTPEENEVYKAWDKPLDLLDESALPHWELGEKYALFSLTDGVKLTGAGFPVYKGKGAKLQRALISYFLDEATAAGYLEIMPPLLVNQESATATGQLPDKEGQMYHATKDDLYLIPTAEVPITNLYRGNIVPEDELPVKMCGYTPCFRREAGSYGADVKGLNRVHQFDKVEIVQLQHPDKSYDSLHDMIGHVSHLLDSLGLPYRILRLCGGDMSFASALTYDFEVYSMAQKRWLEVSSVSNFETFQSNRLALRFKDSDGKNKLLHTLNGSALALARIVAALLENFQTNEGVVIPEVLRKYTGFDIIN